MGAFRSQGVGGRMLSTSPGRGQGAGAGGRCWGQVLGTGDRGQAETLEGLTSFVYFSSTDVHSGSREGCANSFCPQILFTNAAGSR